MQFFDLKLNQLIYRFIGFSSTVLGLVEPPEWFQFTKKVFFPFHPVSVFTITVFLIIY